ncbi:DNA repair protein RecO [Brachymonas sp. M4Q-1]|uniref:DNA repair protein RecO n=1 Tax=Brachymonas sp. M4Q-1 TaxID=3416906 RepID=UPI003CED1223
MKRVLHEPAFVLHRYDWSESSLILEVFTRRQGRTALVAKGAKRPSSNFRPVLLPLQPLHLNYSADGEIGTLKSAEWAGGHVMPVGEALLSGYYLNELLMRLLARDDPHPALFDAYALTVASLTAPEEGTGSQGDWIQAVLRAFELVLLRQIGVLPALDAQTLTQRPLQDAAPYLLTAESGLREAQDEEGGPARATLGGSEWRLIDEALCDPAPQQALIALCLRRKDISLALKNQLRTVLLYHCGGNPLRTRQLLLELQKL